MHTTTQAERDQNSTAMCSSMLQTSLQTPPGCSRQLASTVTAIADRVQRPCCAALVRVTHFETPVMQCTSTRALAAFTPSAAQESTTLRHPLEGSSCWCCRVFVTACRLDPEESRCARQPVGATQRLCASFSSVGRLTKELKAGLEVGRDTGGYKVGEGVFVKILAAGHHLQQAGRQDVSHREA